MTRWSTRDLTGKIIKSVTQKEGVDEWEVRIELPAIAVWPAFVA